MPRISYVNGQYRPHNDASVHIEDRGYQFGDGVYEVIAFIDGVMADERGHLDRLERSLKELQIEMPVPRRTLSLLIREVLRRNRLRNAGIYIQVTRGVAKRDFGFPAAPVKPALVITTRPFDFDASTARKKRLESHHRARSALETRRYQNDWPAGASSRQTRSRAPRRAGCVAGG